MDEQDLEQVEQEASDAPVVEGAQDAAPAPEEGATPEPTQPRHIPYERFAQVYGEAKRWKEFGDFETVKERLARLEQYEQAVEQWKRQQQGQPSQTVDEREQARRQLLELAPELNEVQTVREMVLRMNMERASTYLADLLKQNSITADPELQDDIEDFLEKKMNAAERSAFLAGDLGVVKSLFDRHFGRSGLLAALKPKPLPVAPKPPVRHSPAAGQTPPKATPKPKTREEAENAAWALLAGAKGD